MPHKHGKLGTLTGVQLSDLTFITYEAMGLDDISSYHTYAIASLGNSSTYKFLVDGEILGTGTATATPLNGFQWGVGGFEGDVDWDFVRFAQPGQLPPVMGNSFRCFKVSTAKLVPTPTIELEDEFTVGIVDVVDVRKAKSLCVPVDVDCHGI